MRYKCFPHNWPIIVRGIRASSQYSTSDDPVRQRHMSSLGLDELNHFGNLMITPSMVMSSKWNHFPCYWPFVRCVVTSESPAKRPVRRSFDVFFDLNKRLNKQSWGWWFETPSRSSWRHCNVDKSVRFMTRVTMLAWIHGPLVKYSPGEETAVRFGFAHLFHFNFRLLFCQLSSTFLTFLF